MVPHYAPGEIAGWIAEPKTGINRQSFDFPYVHFANQE
jgi:benzoyl-CoA 2,3-dioxygenase component B